MSVSVEEQIRRSQEVPLLLEQLKKCNDQLTEWVRTHSVFLSSNNNIIGLNGKYYGFLHHIWPYEGQEYLNDNICSNFENYKSKVESLRDFLNTFQSKLESIKNNYETDVASGFHYVFYDESHDSKARERDLRDQAVTSYFRLSSSAKVQDIVMLFQLFELRGHCNIKTQIEALYKTLENYQECTLFPVLIFKGWYENKKDKSAHPRFDVGVYKVCSETTRELIISFVWGVFMESPICICSSDLENAHVFEQKILHFHNKCFDQNGNKLCSYSKGHYTSEVKTVWDIKKNKCCFLKINGGSCVSWDETDQLSDFGSWALFFLDKPKGLKLSSHEKHHDVEDKELQRALLALEEAKKKQEQLENDYQSLLKRRKVD